MINDHRSLEPVRRRCLSRSGSVGLYCLTPHSVRFLQDASQDALEYVHIYICKTTDEEGRIANANNICVMSEVND